MAVKAKNVSEAVVVAGVHAVACRGPNVVTRAPHFRPCGAMPTGHDYGSRAPARPRGSDCRAMILLFCGGGGRAALCNQRPTISTTEHDGTDGMHKVMVWIGGSRKRLIAGLSRTNSRRSTTREPGG